MVTVHQPLGAQPGRILTSTVLGVTLRVAGAVPTEVHAHAVGTAEQQVTARLGDVLVYVQVSGFSPHRGGGRINAVITLMTRPD
jgi:hypothetical protein